MIRAHVAFTCMAFALLAGCGGGDAPDPASLPRDEAQALNDAAAMLNSREDAPAPASKAKRP